MVYNELTPHQNSGDGEIMKYVCFNDKNEAIGTTDKSPYTGTPELDLSHCPIGTVKVVSDHDFESFHEVAKICSDLARNAGEVFLPCDNGPSTSWRFTVCRPPKVGDAVSYTFNGDTTPDGHVTRITPSWTVVTSSGKRYKRSRQTSTWRQTGGTWILTFGHHEERNPHF
jgi:hypothetical protein